MFVKLHRTHWAESGCGQPFLVIVNRSAEESHSSGALYVGTDQQSRRKVFLVFFAFYLRRPVQEYYNGAMDTYHNIFVMKMERDREKFQDVLLPIVHCVTLRWCVPDRHIVRQWPLNKDNWHSVRLQSIASSSQSNNNRIKRNYLPVSTPPTQCG